MECCENLPFSCDVTPARKVASKFNLLPKQHITHVGRLALQEGFKLRVTFIDGFLGGATHIIHGCYAAASNRICLTLTDLGMLL